MAKIIGHIQEAISSDVPTKNNPLCFTRVVFTIISIIKIEL
jgi:hypothetical protein